MGHTATGNPTGAQAAVSELPGAEMSLTALSRPQRSGASVPALADAATPPFPHASLQTHARENLPFDAHFAATDPTPVAAHLATSRPIR